MTGLLARVLGTIVLATVIGAGSAIARLKYGDGIDDLRFGPWQSSSLIGSQQAGSRLRALVAINGILALNRSETMYFTATEDDQGRPLDGACQYRVTGKDPQARWWSLTAYGEDRFLIPNPGHRYSATKDSVMRDGAGTFSIALSTEVQPGDWIASKRGPFILTLRAYNPEPASVQAPRSMALPRIVRETCL